MKKILFWSAVTIIAAVSCNKLENDTPTPSNVPAFEAYVDGAESKTVIDGMASYWNGTERIWVLNGQSGDASWKKAYKATATKAARVTFKEENNVTLTGDDYLAVYPAEPAGSVTWDGNIANAAKGFWLDSAPEAVKGYYNPSTHIAVAYTKKGDYNLNFKNVTSLVKFELTSNNVTEVCFYGNKNEVITGNFDVKYNDGKPIATPNGNTKNTYAKVVAKSGKKLDPGTYYISVLPCTFSEGFSIETLTNGLKSVKKNSNKYSLGRNQVIDLGKIDNIRTIYLDAATHWNNDGAIFMAHYWGGNTEGDVSLKHVEGNLYKCNIPSAATNVIFVRKDPNSQAGNPWVGEWGRVETTLSSANNQFTMSSYSAGSWSKKY